MATDTPHTTRPHHPEAPGDEILIGNMFAGDFRAVGWQTKRKAKAYQLDGKQITTTDGDAVLPVAAVTGDAEVVVLLGGTTRYAETEGEPVALQAVACAGQGREGSATMGHPLHAQAAGA